MLEDLSLDFETYSEIDLVKEGVHNYAVHPSTGAHCAAYAYPGEEPEIWIEGQPFPERIRKHVTQGGRIRAFNAAFERVMWRDCMVRKCGWPVVPMRQFVCTMAEGRAMALPGALDKMAPAVGLELMKDAEGKRIMLQLRKPRPSDNKLWRPKDAPEKFRKLYDYCKQDVRVEQAIVPRIRRLIPSEQELYYITEEINDQGVYIDEELCTAAQKIIDEATVRLTAEMRRVSGFEIAGPNAVAQIKTWLISKGLEITSLDKDRIADLLKRDDLAPDVQRVLEIRRDAAKSSTAKIGTMLRRRGKDGRARGMFIYHGASTGRYSVSGLQLQNYTRPDPTIDTSECIQDILAGDFDWLEIMHGSALNAVSSCLRGCLAAAPGYEMFSVDSSQIELRINAYLSGEERVLEGFRKYDTILGVDAKGKELRAGPDAYVVSAAGIYGIPIEEVDKDIHRPTGKVAELALGFLGGAGALLKMAKQHRVDLTKIENSVRGAATLENIDKAEWAWESRGAKSGTRKSDWITAELIKLAWRDSHPATVKYAYSLKAVAQRALRNPGPWHDTAAIDGETVSSGLIAYRKSGSWLCCRLPCYTIEDGKRMHKVIYYPNARLGVVKTPWGVEQQSVIAKSMNISNQWVDRAVTPGILIENVVQATARGTMTAAMPKIRQLPWYDLELSIHDELVAEAPQGEGNVAELADILAEVPEWLPGCPLAAAGWVGSRFRK